MSNELVRSLVEGYSQRLAHEEQIEEINSEWRTKEREWDLNAEVRLAVTSRNQLYSYRLEYIFRVQATQQLRPSTVTSCKTCCPKLKLLSVHLPACLHVCL